MKTLFNAAVILLATLALAMTVNAQPFKIWKSADQSGVTITTYCVDPPFVPRSWDAPARPSPCVDTDGRTLVQVQLTKELYDAPSLIGIASNGSGEAPVVVMASARFANTLNGKTYLYALFLFSRPASQVREFRVVPVSDGPMLKLVDFEP